MTQAKTGESSECGESGECGESSECGEAGKQVETAEIFALDHRQKCF